MRWILLAMGFAIFLVSCSGAYKFAVDMPGERRVIYTQFTDVQPEGTDVNYVVAWDCPSFQAFENWKSALSEAKILERVLTQIAGVEEPKCVVVGQYGGSSPGLLKAVFNGVAAGAAISTGIALQDFKGDSVSVSGTSGSSSKSGAAAISKSSAKGGSATISQPKRRKKH